MNEFDIINDKLDMLLHNSNLEYKAKEPEIVLTKWDKKGLSLSFTEWGGREIKAVNELIQSWIDSGDENKKIVAEQQSKYYVFRTPDDKFNKQIAKDIALSQQMAWLNAMYGASVEEYKIYNQEKKKGVERGVKEIVENHDLISYGNYSAPNFPDWKTKFYDIIPRLVEMKMDHELVGVRWSNR